MFRCFILHVVLLECILLGIVADDTHDWTYSMQRLEVNTSDPDQVLTDVRLLRKSSGEYAINGTVSINFDIDNTFLAEVLVLRSAPGTNQYTMTPYQIKRQPFYDFMTTAYVNMVQNELSACTNLPTYKDKFEGPFTLKQLNLNLCIIDNESFPNHMQPGNYILWLRIFKEGFVDFGGSVYAEVEPKYM